MNSIQYCWQILETCYQDMAFLTLPKLYIAVPGPLWGSMWPLDPRWNSPYFSYFAVGSTVYKIHVSNFNRLHFTESAFNKIKYVCILFYLFSLINYSLSSHTSAKEIYFQMGLIQFNSSSCETLEYELYYKVKLNNLISLRSFEKKITVYWQ